TGRLERTFAALASAGRKALIPFITAGDPSLEATVPVMHALAGAGADVIELGVPFSDPMADGPVIQRSSERSMPMEVTLAVILDLLREFRRRDEITPVVLLDYDNPIEAMGGERCADRAAASGVDGVMVVDYQTEGAQGVV